MQTAIAAIKVPLKDDHLRRLQQEPQLPKLVLTAIQARETSGAKANPANGHQVERRWTRGRAGRPKEGSQSVSQSVSRPERIIGAKSAPFSLALGRMHGKSCIFEREAKPLGTSIYDVSTEGEGHKMHQIC